ncbi:MAG: hypothetical protein AAF206_17545, partial [Bacteroidota bacterium]
MKTSYILMCISFLLLGAMNLQAQEIVREGELTRSSKDGVDFWLKDGQPFTGFIVGYFPNGKTQKWISIE